MGLFDDCKQHFGTDDLYRVLSASEKATFPELKKAYKQLSLLVHPDRVDDAHKDEATKKFQVLSRVYFILSDEEKRKVYDDTGEIDEENAMSEDKDWTAYWRLLFPKITLNDIEKFMETYKGSDEERENLKKYYIQFSGNMDKVSMHLMGYQYEEEERYREILLEMIANEEIPSFIAFTKESKSKRNARIRKYEKEAKEAEVLKQELKNGEDELASAISKRQVERKNKFDDMITSLEQKYCKPQRKKKK